MQRKKREKLKPRAGRGEDGLPPGAGRGSFDLIDSEALFKALRLKKGSAFLDIACGRGMYTLAAAGRVGAAGAVYAVDLWADGIAELEAEAAARGLANIKAMVADVGARLPLADRTVDVALMATVLHDLVEERNEEGALREAARVLKPGGRFAVVEFKKIDGPPGPPRKIRLEPEETERLVTRFGFAKPVAALDLGPYNYLLMFRRRRRPVEIRKDPPSGRP